MKLADVAQCLRLDMPPGPVWLTGVSIDSRAVKPGDLFVCLRGSRVDGHDFAEQAQNAGAAAILAERPLPADAPVIVVNDTERALGELAAFWRKRASARVVCVTGTAGKTTLKDTLAAILNEAGSAACTPGNHNNQIGLPLTILNAAGDEDFWLLEAGISHAGDMEYLARIAAPDLAIILNVGHGHTEGLGEKGVAWHKTRILNFLSPRGVGLLNADYPDLLAEAERTGTRFECFGSHAGKCAFTLVERNHDNYTLDLCGKAATFRTPFNAPFGWEITLAAAGAASLLGIPAEKIQAGFTNAVLPVQRFRHLISGRYRIIDDTYNANPLSMRRVLEAASEEARSLQLPLVLVLGEMGELGSEARAEHRALGGFLRNLDASAVFWKGAWLDEVVAGSEGASGGINIVPFNSPDEFAGVLRERAHILPERALVLFKGSRANRLEKYLEAFIRAQETEGVL